jgi:Immunoglobulin I-set domain
MTAQHHRQGQSMTPNLRSARWLFPSIFACLALVAVFASGQAQAAGFGELAGFSEGSKPLARFNGKGTNKKGTNFAVSEETQVFGRDAVDGSFYVGGERGEEDEKYKLQKYNAKGEFEAELELQQSQKELPAGIVETSGLEGAAIDHERGILYLLARYKRSYEDAVDPSQEVAGALLAFKISPTGGILEPAPGTKTEGGLTGVLASSSTLNAASETFGKALLQPSGIAVDPKTHEVVILGLTDGGTADEPEVFYQALQGVKEENGELGRRWVGPESVGISGGDSPVVSQNGNIFYEYEDEILQVPSGSGGAAIPLLHFEQPESLPTGLFYEELLALTNGEAYGGGGLAIEPEGTEGGRLVVDTEVNQVEPEGKSKFSNWSADTFKYAESGEQVTLTEVGWTGGQPGEEGREKSCTIGFGGESYPEVAAGPSETLFVLAPSTEEVIEFGPGGEHCPTAKAFDSIEATLKGKKLTSVPESVNVTLSGEILQADVQSVEWSFGDGETTVKVPLGEQTQTAEVAHKFTKTGELPVKAIVHTNDLATPTVELTGTVNVESETGPGAPSITKAPVNQTVVEGETAKFEATASGEPTPTVQWEESQNGGSTWTEVAGATSNSLTIADTTRAESGRDYRAVFENEKGAKTSTAAVLTVNAKETGGGPPPNNPGNNNSGNNPGTTTTTTETTPKQEVKPFQESSPKVTIASNSLQVSSSGAVTVKVACAAGAKTCTGTVTLRTLTAVAARIVAGATKKKPKASILTLASSSFALAGGQSKALTLHLSTKARQLLAHSHTLKAKATIVAHNQTGTSQTTTAVLTLRLAKKSKHH